MTRGWAFLVARGRHHGYRSILVPDFIADNRENGYLTENVRGAVDGSDRPRIARIVAPASGPVTLAYHTHRVTRGDLDASDRDTGDTGDPGGPGDPGHLVTDEHGRPLDLLYGFAARGQAIDDPDEADLRSAKDEALAAYRRFLADEASFRTETSTAFPLRSVATKWAEPVARPVVQPAAPSVARSAARPGLTGPRLWTMLIGAITIAIVATLGRHWLASPSPAIAVDKPLECTLEQADDDLTCDIPVRITITGATDQTTVEATTQPQSPSPSRWSVDPGSCGTHGDDGSCTLKVTIEVSAGTPDADHTTTLTLTSRQPHHTRSVRLTAHADG